MGRMPHIQPSGDTMLDFRIENPITLEQAAQFAPGYTPGQPTTIGTVRRWARRGLRGVKLDTTMAGGRRCTSREELQRFFAALTQAREPDGAQPRRRQHAGTSDATRLALAQRHGLATT